MKSAGEYLRRFKMGEAKLTGTKPKTTVMQEAPLSEEERKARNAQYAAGVQVQQQAPSTQQQQPVRNREERGIEQAEGRENRYEQGTVERLTTAMDRLVRRLEAMDGQSQNSEAQEELSEEEDGFPVRTVSGSTPRSSRAEGYRYGTLPAPRPPKIPLQVFDGDIRRWPAFISNFRRYIHRREADNEMRMAYLHEMLAPAVRDSIAEFLTV